MQIIDKIQTVADIHLSNHNGSTSPLNGLIQNNSTMKHKTSIKQANVSSPKSHTDHPNAKTDNIDSQYSQNPFNNPNFMMGAGYQMACKAPYKSLVQLVSLFQI